MYSAHTGTRQRLRTRSLHRGDLRPRAERLPPDMFAARACGADLEPEDEVADRWRNLYKLTPNGHDAMQRFRTSEFS